MSLQSALSTYVDNIGNLIQGYHDIMDECATHNVTLQGEPIADWASIIGTALASGGAPTLITKTITTNNTYIAADDNADGYSSVTVNVPSSASLTTKTITDNGTYNASGDNADGYSTVIVSLPLDTKNITANGDYYASAETIPLKGYTRVSVSVLPNVNAKTITTNNTYNAIDDGLDGYSSVTVNVPGGSANLEQNVVFTTNGLKNPSTGYDGFGPVTVQVPTTGGRIIGEPQFSYYIVTNWIASTSYIIGDIVIYLTDTYYCIENNDDAEFTAAHWLKIID